MKTVINTRLFLKLFFTFIMIVPFACLHSETKAQSNIYIQESIQAARKYEEAGDYVTALRLARSLHEDAIKLGLTEQAASLLQCISSLEKKVLHKGRICHLLDDQNKPRLELIHLFQVIGMNTPPSEIRLSTIDTWAQKNLLYHKEQSEEQIARFESLAPTIKPILTNLGFINQVAPSFKEYQGAIIVGTFLPQFRKRLEYIVQEWKSGAVRFSHLYFLGSDRPLVAEYENQKTFLHNSDSSIKIRHNWQKPAVLPKTELEMMQLVWDQSEIPEEMKKLVQVHFSTIPMTKEVQTGLLIPAPLNTVVEKWRQTKPLEGVYLTVTNQPYITYQDLVFHSLSPKEYFFDTVGPQANPQEKMAVFLDEVARVIHQVK